MSVQVTLAWRYLRGRGLRTVLTTLAVALGVMVIFGLNGLVPAMVDAFRSSTLGAAGQVDISVTSDSGGTFATGVAREVARVPGVAAASPALRRQITLPQKPGQDAATAVALLTVSGVDPAGVTRVRTFSLATGRLLSASDRNVMVLASDLAARLGVGLGGTVRLPSSLGTQDFRVVGLLSSPTPPGGEEVLVPLRSAQTLLALPDRISAVEAKYADGADFAAVDAGIQRTLGPDYKVGGTSSLDQLFASVKVSEFAFNMFGVFAFVAGGFIILNTFRTVVSERRRDVGMLRAIGATRSTVVGMFLLEAVFQGLLGTGVGLLAGWAMAAGMVAAITPVFDRYFPGLRIGGPQFATSTWVTAIGLGIAVTVASALLPALAAGRVTPLEALRPALGAVYERASKRRGWIGAGVCGVAVLLFLTRSAGMAGLGAVLVLIGVALAAPALVRPLSEAFGALFDIVFDREGLVARSNLQRNPGRSGTTATAVMLGLAMIIAMLGVFSSIFTGFIDYLDKSLGADFLFMPQSIVLSQGNVGAGPRLMEEIRHTDGISAAASLRLAQSKVDGGAVQAVGIDPVAYPKVASFEWSRGSDAGAIDALGRGRELIANGIYASQKGVAPGDHLVLETPNGPRTYRVAAIGSDYLNAKLATVYISQENLKHDFGSTTDLLLMADMRPGADRASVERRLRSILRDYPAFRLYDAQSWRAEQLTTFDQTMSVMYVLIGALALPSLLALINTLAMSVIARTREIGMLRAVGSTRRQVRRTVIAESLMLASIGTLFGVVTGIWIGYALVEAMNTVGFPMPYAFPWTGILVAIVVGLASALLAAVIPARKAARLDVVEALHYE